LKERHAKDESDFVSFCCDELVMPSADALETSQLLTGKNVTKKGEVGGGMTEQFVGINMHVESRHWRCKSQA
jgi:hypothetical protein